MNQIEMNGREIPRTFIVTRSGGGTNGRIRVDYGETQKKTGIATNSQQRRPYRN